MSTRIPRIFQPGNPQRRVFLPDFWMKLVPTPKFGRERVPPNVVKFEVSLQMSRNDVRQYLEKIYKIPVYDVRIMNKMGDITWSAPLDKNFRRALWKEEDKKIAFVYMPKHIKFEYPTLFDDAKFEKELDDMNTQQDSIVDKGSPFYN
ncbi:39S ribosomal protein L23, mitochondrial [Strongyloides ratti]|uniref:Large ribosomal subunit protein uL23m n=1 Tax=Strongyloides ratti TaxID=34506 RepID=A0A090MVP7_STRRB|nr:39S ribosomal protein L23, mitochondrial [Strongyloides ratti]CEF63033.1 39S ribosomal protein L23, mitochondrial [Strongyloides ratti]